MMKFNEYVTTHNDGDFPYIDIFLREEGLPISCEMTILPILGNNVPTPYNMRTVNGSNSINITIKNIAFQPVKNEYVINFGQLPYPYSIYGGILNVDKSGFIELIMTHTLFDKSSYYMDNTEYEPGWKNSGIKDIIGEGVNGYINGYASNIDSNFKVKADTTNGNDTLILPYDDYGVTQTQWINDIHNNVKLVIELKEPQRFILQPQQILTPPPATGMPQSGTLSSNSNTIMNYVVSPASDGNLKELFKSSISHKKKQEMRITYLLNDTVFDESDVVSGSFSFLSNGTDDNAVKFGNAYSNEIQFQLIGNDKMQTLNVQNEFKVEFGFAVDKAFWADEVWLTLGYFKSKDITYDKTSNVYTITAYDRMTHFDVDAKDFIAHLDENTTYDPKDMFELLCRYVGVEYEPLTYSPTRKVSASNFNEISTLRELLNKIAEVYCSYAKITGEGKVKIEENAFGTVYNIIDMNNSNCYQLSETSQRKNYENSVWNDIAKFQWNELRGTKWSELYDEDDNYYFHGVKVVLSNEQVITYPSNLSSEEIMRDCYEINNNPFYNGYIDPDYLSELPDVIRDTIYTKLITNFQLPYSTEVSADDYFILAETGDVIKKYLEDGVTYYLMPVYNHSFVWNGSFVCGISSARSLNDNK